MYTIGESDDSEAVSWFNSDDNTSVLPDLDLPDDLSNLLDVFSYWFRVFSREESWSPIRRHATILFGKSRMGCSKSVFRTAESVE